MNSRICIVCYDVSNNKTRRKLAKLISGYGKRVQGSVFLCDIDSDRQRDLEVRLRGFYANSKKASKNNKKVVSFKKKKTNTCNTLDILMIPMPSAQIETALILGKELDVNKKFIVI